MNGTEGRLTKRTDGEEEVELFQNQNCLLKHRTSPRSSDNTRTRSVLRDGATS